MSFGFCEQDHYGIQYKRWTVWWHWLVKVGVAVSTIASRGWKRRQSFVGWNPSLSSTTSDMENVPEGHSHLCQTEHFMLQSNMADDLTCQEKVNLEKDGAPLNKFIELSPEDYWSGCREDPQTRWLVCKGGRSYKVQNETTLITAISR